MASDRAPAEIVIFVVGLLLSLAVAAGAAYGGWWVYQDRHPDVWATSSDASAVAR